MTLEEKWTAVKDYYRKAYPSFAYIFDKRLADKQIELLYGKMKQLEVEFADYYKHQPFLAHRLQYLRGQSPSPIAKRGHDE